MDTLIGSCMAICMAVIAIGGVMMIVAAFRVSIVWGLAYLLVPFAALVFLFKHWAEAKKGFLINATALCVFLGLFFTFPQSRPAVAGWVVGHWVPSAVGSANQQKDKYEPALSEARERLATLQTERDKLKTETDVKFQELTSRRNALNIKDQPAVLQFNVEATAYLKQMEQVKGLTQELADANAAVEDLLAKRAAEKKQVVIYSASWCSVCQQAKRYMDSKGISYREVDVEKSREGADEYRRLGGDGAVPLIVVGDRKMRGFNPSQLDSML